MPFDGEDLSSLALNVLHGNVRSIRSLRPDCPAPLAAVVERALARQPDRRFASAAGMLAALNDVALDEGAWGSALRALRPANLLRLSHGRAPRVALSMAAIAGSLLWSPWLLSSPRPERPTHHVQLAGPTAAGEIILTQLRAEQTAPEVRQLFEITPTTEPLTMAAGAPSPRAVDQARAAALVRKALASYLHGEIAAAYSAYRKATQSDPSDASAFRGLGLSASRLGKSHEARRAYARYLELSPRAADVEQVKARLAQLGVAGARP
jgi:tetratricopeptide (TPR) repeat protein